MEARSRRERRGGTTVAVSTPCASPITGGGAGAGGLGASMLEPAAASSATTSGAAQCGQDALDSRRVEEDAPARPPARQRPGRPERRRTREPLPEPQAAQVFQDAARHRREAAVQPLAPARVDREPVVAVHGDQRGEAHAPRRKPAQGPGVRGGRAAEAPSIRACCGWARGPAGGD